MTTPNTKPSRCRSLKVGAAGPILLLTVLLLLPNVSFAANSNTSLFVQPGWETTGKTCLNSNTETTEVNATVTQYTDSDTNLYNYSYITARNCVNGCSSTLSSCRPDKFMEGTLFLLLLVLFGIPGYFGPRFKTVGYLAALTALIFSLLIATWDIFTFPFNIVTRLLPLAILVNIGWEAYWEWKVPEITPDEEGG